MKAGVALKALNVFKVLKWTPLCEEHGLAADLTRMESYLFIVALSLRFLWGNVSNIDI